MARSSLSAPHRGLNGTSPIPSLPCAWPLPAFSPAGCLGAHSVIHRAVEGAPAETPPLFLSGRVSRSSARNIQTIRRDNGVALVIDFSGRRIRVVPRITAVVVDVHGERSGVPRALASRCWSKRHGGYKRGAHLIGELRHVERDLRRSALPEHSVAQVEGYDQVLGRGPAVRNELMIDKLQDD